MKKASERRAHEEEADGGASDMIYERRDRFIIRFSYWQRKNTAFSRRRIRIHIYTIPATFIICRDRRAESRGEEGPVRLYIHRRRPWENKRPISV